MAPAVGELIKSYVGLRLHSRELLLRCCPQSCHCAGHLASTAAPSAQMAVLKSGVRAEIHTLNGVW